MPFGKITKKEFKKIDPNRKYYKRKRKAPAANRVVSKTAAIPDMFMTRLKYTDSGAIVYGGLGTPALHSWNMNNIFDPNRTGTGHQPLGHDQLGLLYNRYRVYGFKYTVTFTNRSTTEHVEVAILTRPNTATINDQSVVRESPSCVYKATLGVEGSGQAIRSFTGYVSIAKIRGVTKKAVQIENDYGAIFGTPPAIEPTLQVYAFNPITTTGVTIDHRVDFEIYTTLYDRKILPIS